MSIIKCGTINPNLLKIAGKPNRAMTPEVKLTSTWVDRKNDYRRNKEKQKIRRYSEEYGNDGSFVLDRLRAGLGMSVAKAGRRFFPDGRSGRNALACSPSDWQ